MTEKTESTPCDMLVWKYRMLCSKLDQYIPGENKDLQKELKSLRNLISYVCKSECGTRAEALLYCRYIFHDFVRVKRFKIYQGEYEAFCAKHGFEEDIQKDYYLITELEELPVRIKFTDEDELVDWGSRIMGFIRIDMGLADIEVVQLGGHKRMSARIFARYTSGIYLWKKETVTTGGKKGKPGVEKTSLVPDRSFADIFLNRKEFDNMASVHRLLRSYGHPPNSSFKDELSGDLCYNSWRGFRILPQKPADADNEEKKAFEVLKNHINEVICDGDANIQFYLWGWLAHLVQHPEEKPGTCICITGQEGSGKGGFVKILEKILGSAYGKAASTSSLESNFSACLIEPILYVFDEFKYTAKIMEMLKSLITDDVQAWENKNEKRQSVKTYTRYIILTNNEKVIPLHDGSRRFMVVRSSDKYCIAALHRAGKVKSTREAVEYHNRFFQSIDKGVGLFMNHLMTYDLTNWKPTVIPDTLEAARQREYSKTPLRTFVEELMLFEKGDYGVIGQRMGVNGECAFIDHACDKMQCNKVMYISHKDLWDNYERSKKVYGGNRTKAFNALIKEMGETNCCIQKSSARDQIKYMVFNLDPLIKSMEAELADEEIREKKRQARLAKLSERDKEPDSPV